MKNMALLLSLLLPFNFFLGCNQSESDNNNIQNKMKDLPNNLLLKDWQPKSLYKIPITQIERAKFPVIDMHAHNYTLTDNDIAERAQILEQLNVEKSVVFVENTGKEFDSVCKKYSVHPVFYVFCGIDFSGFKDKGWSAKVIEELNECVKTGARGIGEIIDKGSGLSNGSTFAEGLHPDDPRMDPIWEECARLHIPVNLHISDPIWMYMPMDSLNDGLMRSWTWRVNEKDRVNSHDDMMRILSNTLKRHPNTAFVVAHLANCTYDLSILGKMFDGFPNFYADISARFAEFSSVPKYTSEFFIKYQNRLVYGTDYGWELWQTSSDLNSDRKSGYNPYGQKEPDLGEMYRMTFRVLETTDEHFYMTNLLEYKWPMYGLGLSTEVLKKIYSLNADKIIKSE